MQGLGVLGLGFEETLVNRPGFGQAAGLLQLDGGVERRVQGGFVCHLLARLLRNDAP